MAQNNPPEEGASAGRRRKTAAQRESAVDQAIREAQERGAFDNLPGRGKPIQWSTTHDDPERWLAQHILENAGYRPVWVEEGRELRAEREALLAIEDRSTATFRRRVETFNKRVERYNLSAPTAQLHIARLRLDEDTAS